MFFSWRNYSINWKWLYRVRGESRWEEGRWKDTERKRLSFWDDTLPWHLQWHRLYLWLGCFSGEWEKFNFSIIQTFSLLHMPGISKPFLLFCLCSPLQMCCGLPMISPPPQILWQTKTTLPTALFTPELTKAHLFHTWANFYFSCSGLCQSSFTSPSPWLVYWYQPFFWFSRHMPLHMTLSSQDLA